MANGRSAHLLLAEVSFILIACTPTAVKVDTDEVAVTSQTFEAEVVAYSGMLAMLYAQP